MITTFWLKSIVHYSGVRSNGVDGLVPLVAVLHEPEMMKSFGPDECFLNCQHTLALFAFLNHELQGEETNWTNMSSPLCESHGFHAPQNHLGGHIAEQLEGLN